MVNWLKNKIKKNMEHQERSYCCGYQQEYDAATQAARKSKPNELEIFCDSELADWRFAQDVFILDFPPSPKSKSITEVIKK